MSRDAWSMAAAVLLTLQIPDWLARHVVALGLCAVVAIHGIGRDSASVIPVAGSINLTEGDDGESSDGDGLRGSRVTWRGCCPS
jgi:hypothetical protein